MGWNWLFIQMVHKLAPALALIIGYGRIWSVAKTVKMLVMSIGLSTVQLLSALVLIIFNGWKLVRVVSLIVLKLNTPNRIL